MNNKLFGNCKDCIYGILSEDNYTCDDCINGSEYTSFKNDYLALKAKVNVLLSDFRKDQVIIKDLKNEVVSKQLRAEKYRHQVLRADEEFIVQGNEKDDLKEQIQTLEAENRYVLKNFKTVLKNNNSLKEQVKQLIEDLRITDKGNKAFTEIINGNVVEIKRLKDKVQSLKNEIKVMYRFKNLNYLLGSIYKLESEVISLEALIRSEEESK